MSTPPSNPYAHNPDAEGDSSGAGASPYGPNDGQGGAPGYHGGFNEPLASQPPYSQPNYQRPGAPNPYGGFPQQPGYPNAPYQGGGMGWGENSSKNSLGGWALGTGIAGLICCAPASIAAIIVGALGRKAAEQGLATNRSMATTGFVLGIVGVGLNVLLFAYSASSGGFSFEF